MKFFLNSYFNYLLLINSVKVCWPACIWYRINNPLFTDKWFCCQEWKNSEQTWRKYLINVHAQTFRYLRLYYYHRVDTSAGRLLVPERIIHPAVSLSALTWFIRYISVWNLVSKLYSVTSSFCLAKYGNYFYMVIPYHFALTKMLVSITR